VKDNICGITENSDPVWDDSWIKWVYEKNQPAILITKDIKTLLQKYTDLLNKNILIHCSITGLGGVSFIEPNTPKPQDLIEFLHTIEKKEKIVIRIDPIFPIKSCIQQAKRIKDQLSDFKRFRVSILDLYPHVRERFKKNNPAFYDELRKIYGDKYIHADLELRKAIIKLMGDVEVCGEPYDIDKSPPWNITPCVSQQDLDILGIKEFEQKEFKQREFCGCLSAKKELLKKGTCKFGCQYCYWKD
jgi:DNA repair photolyase